MKPLTSTHRSSRISLAGAVLALLLSSAPARVVTNTNDSGAGSLRQAIADAPSGDTITFDASLSGQTIVLTSGQLTVDKDLVIDASGLAHGITVDGNEATRIFRFTEGSTSTLTGLTIIKGYADEGGGIRNQGTLTINDCTLSGNSADAAGGGISNGGKLLVNHSTLSGNKAGYYYYGLYDGGEGGGVFNTEEMEISNSILRDNIAGWTGGGIDTGGKATISNSTLHQNEARGDAFYTGSGGGIYHSWGWLTVDSCMISANYATVCGGGILGSSYCGTINNCIITGNTADEGGGIYQDAYGSFSINNCILSRNSASIGGGYCGEGEGYLENCILSENSADRGGGVFELNCQAIPSYGLPCFLTFANNCVFYANSGGNWWIEGFCIYGVCIPTREVGGFDPEDNIITTDPLFVAPDDYRLQPGSPCIDAGKPAWGIVDDIEGTPRPLDGDNDGVARIDIGAYEYVHPDADSDADGLADGFELDTTGTNPTLVNTDGDPDDDFEEWVTDTDGTDPEDWFRVTSTRRGAHLFFRFQSSARRQYSLLYTTGPDAGVWTPVSGQTDIMGTGDKMGLTDKYPPGQAKPPKPGKPAKPGKPGKSAKAERHYQVEVQVP